MKKKSRKDNNDSISFNELNRPTRKKSDIKGFFTEPGVQKWEDHWWGMPEFTMGDARPRYQITMNFMTREDVKEFANKTGLGVTTKSNSAWFPPQKRMKAREYIYIGEPTNSKYPICIPSKGRADCQKTGKALDKLGVSYNFFVEETEYEEYCKYIEEDKVIAMPFHDLGQGSIPARNFIWDWALEQGHKRHWTVDDNIRCFLRLSNNHGCQVDGGGFFRAMEDFVDRYKNVAMAGPHHDGFVPDRSPNTAPFLFNSRVYSCILLDSTLPYRWRGKYNEDTDLSLRLLKDGHCTLLFRSLCMHKDTTVGAKDAKPLKGGNTDNVYNTDDHRLAFAKSLQEQHPDVVKVVWKFNRWHHQVDYSPFRGNKPEVKPGIIPTKTNNEYGMSLARQK